MLAGGQADGWNSNGGIDTETENLAATLSLWTDIEAVLEFAYGRLYRRAIDQGQKWFCTPSYPAYVMWWISDGAVPTWREACQRLEHLHDHGPTSFAFDFQGAFNCEVTSMA